VVLDVVEKGSVVGVVRSVRLLLAIAVVVSVAVGISVGISVVVAIAIAIVAGWHCEQTTMAGGWNE
jgi:hypothetical protein